MKRTFIVGSVLDNKINVFEEDFESEDELNQYLEDFDTYDIVLCLNEEQVKDLKEKLQ